jgi:hypothetical protein
MTFAFKIGDQVEPIAGKDIVGIVTAYLIRSGDHVTYEVTWFHNGEAKSRWFGDVEIKPHGKKERNGFA